MDTKKILIAEDERPLARALELKLGSSGFAVKTVFDGEEALQVLQTETFDLLLLDLMMPKKDGFAVLQELKDKNIKIPTIVSSNLSQEEDSNRAKSMGAVDYYVKSDTPLSEIVRHVQKVFETA